MIPDWSKATLTKQKKVEFAGLMATCFLADFTSCGISWDPGTDYLGVDPGRYFGVSVLGDYGVWVYNGTMPKGTHDEYGSFAVKLIKDICTLHCLTPWDVSIVEGASYGSPFGQVGLAEIRFGFFLGLQEFGLEPKMVAPASVRKAVFGNGKQQAMDIFPILNHNAADSLAIALYGCMQKGG